MQKLLEILSLFIGLTFFAFVIVFGVVIVSHAIDREEISSCKELVAQSEKYPNFFITEWQKNMCDRHSIAIEAPVSHETKR